MASHSLIHVQIHSLNYSLTHLFPRPLTHAVYTRLCTHTRPHGYTSCTPVRPQGAEYLGQPVTPTMWATQRGFRLWGSERSRAKEDPLGGVQRWGGQVLGGLSLPQGPRWRVWVSPSLGEAEELGAQAGAGGRVRPLSSEASAAGVGSALGQTDGGSSHHPGPLWAVWLNLSGPQCHHLWDERW